MGVLSRDIRWIVYVRYVRYISVDSDGGQKGLVRRWLVLIEMDKARAIIDY